MFENISAYSIRITNDLAFEKLALDLYVEDKYAINPDYKRHVHAYALIELCRFAQLKYVPNIGPAFVFKTHHYWFVINQNLKTETDLTIY